MTTQHRSDAGSNFGDPFSVDRYILGFTNHHFQNTNRKHAPNSKSEFGATRTFAHQKPSHPRHGLSVLAFVEKLFRSPSRDRAVTFTSVTHTDHQPKHNNVRRYHERHHREGLRLHRRPRVPPRQVRRRGQAPRHDRHGLQGHPRDPRGHPGDRVRRRHLRARRRRGTSRRTKNAAPGSGRATIERANDRVGSNARR